MLPKGSLPHQRLGNSAASMNSNRLPSFSHDIHASLDGDQGRFTTRTKALAQAKSLDAPEHDERASFPIERAYTRTADLEKLRKKRQINLQAFEQIADSVHLPQSPIRAEDHEMQCIYPVSVPDQSYKPLPAAPYPSIMPLAGMKDKAKVNAENQRLRERDGKRDKPEPMDIANERSTNANRSMRTYNRGRTRWTDQEVESLIKGVTIYGMGRWKSILEHPGLHFQQGRTSTDLKDR